MSLTLARVYDRSERPSGKRFLVDRVWPRGLKKEQLHLDGWLRELAPSAELRKWFGHDPERWQEFRRRYLAELREAAKRAQLKQLATLAQREEVVLLFGARDPEHNQAVVLADALRKLAAD